MKISYGKTMGGASAAFNSILNYPFRMLDFHSVLPADNHVHVSGRRILRYPIDEYPPGTKDAPQNVFATRECYERTLRGLVTKYGPHERIRWMVGTATGVKAQDESEESNKITSVIVRTREAKDEEVSTSLVAGASDSLFVYYLKAKLNVW